MEKTRREFLGVGAIAGIGMVGTGFRSDAKVKKIEWQGGESPWAMCLDTATLALPL